MFSADSACRARIWTAAEATSIWSEIVDERKRQLQSPENESIFSYASVLAGQVILTRDQLAEWDNSARAWLRNADKAKNLQQTQVILILNNLSLAVSSKPSTYESVVSAWVTALRGMEHLLSGVSQNAQEGGLLLALTCWHLYPNIIVSLRKHFS